MSNKRNLGLAKFAKNVDSEGAFASTLFDENSTKEAVHLGISSGIGGTPRIGFFNGTANQNWQIDNSSGNFRVFKPGTVYLNIDSGGNVTPGADSAQNLGSASKKWKDLFLSGSTINLGTVTIQDHDGALHTQHTFSQGSGAHTTKRYIMTCSTTDSSETEMFLSGTDSSRIPVATSATLFYEASIVARRTDATGESGAWHLKGCADNFSGTVADVGDVYEVAVAQDDVNWAVDARASDSANAIKVFVTGSAKDINWTAIVSTIEVCDSA